MLLGIIISRIHVILVTSLAWPYTLTHKALSLAVKAPALQTVWNSSRTLVVMEPPAFWWALILPKRRLLVFL